MENPPIADGEPPPRTLASRLRRLPRELFASYQDPQLPDRIRRSIQHQQENSEIVIGWVQLAIVVTFASLYSLAPKALGADAAFAPVPIALSAYFAFTALRLILAHRRALPYWFLGLSVVIDIGLLMGLIWSFHIQYDQPASFYLKVPTLLYVFIFIVLRALRFEAGFVLLSGFVAALGWLAMVWYATNVDPQDPMITKDYVEYMTSNSVLLGAEFDKVISILIVTVVLAVSLRRARMLLVRATLETNRAEALSRFVPSEVARDVVDREEGPQAGDGAVREATILFVDLEGFTSLSEQLEPPEVIETLNDYFRAVAVPLEAHQGVITQFQGDAILASFNVPRPDAAHARQAIEAALDIHELLANRTFGRKHIALKARVGINTGTVIGGLVGTLDRVGYTVHGDAVNLAARLEAHNKECGTRILVSDRTRLAAGPTRITFENRGTVQVRGKRETVSIFSIPLREPTALQRTNAPSSS